MKENYRLSRKLVDFDFFYFTLLVSVEIEGGIGVHQRIR